MAQSRLEKIGTIYERITSLIKAGGMKEEARPFWVDLYKAFPPKYEPRYDRPKSTAPIRQIFYPEDRLRARFHKEYKHFSMVNLADNNAVSRTEQFLMTYRNLQEAGVPEDELYTKAVEEFVSKFKAEKDTRAEEAQKTGRRPRQAAHLERLFKDIELKGEDKSLKESEESELSTEDKKKYRPVRLSMDKIVEVMKEEDKKPE